MIVSKKRLHELIEAASYYSFALGRRPDISHITYKEFVAKCKELGFSADEIIDVLRGAR